MGHLFTRVVEQLVAQLTGPMKFRMVLQPAMAIFLAVRGGVQDAREGMPPYFWGLFTDLAHCMARLKDGWKSVGRVFIIAIVAEQSASTSCCGGSTRLRPFWSRSL